MPFATHAEQVAAIKADGEKPKNERIYDNERAMWRKSLSLNLEWRTNTTARAMEMRKRAENFSKWATALPARP